MIANALEPSAWWEGLHGFRRSDGRKGIRNLVVIMAAADNVNPLVRQLSQRCPAVVSIPASYGRGQMGEDFEVTLRAMAGLASHPNVAKCLIVSFEPESGARIAERLGIRRADVRTLCFLESGGLERSIEVGTALLRELISEADTSQREPLDIAELVVGLECGGSDVTSGLFGNPALGAFTDVLVAEGGTAVFSEPVECLGAESLLKKRAASKYAAERLLRTVQKYDQLARENGVDLAGTNPTPDNMAGGLTSIEEKSLGALAKTGTATINGVLDYAEAARGPGVWMMDAPAAAVENITALAAGGAQLICFVTGSCNPSGHPISPTIKISANPGTAERLPSHLDVDLSAMSRGEMGLAEARDRIASAVAKVIRGTRTAAEKLNYLESNISRFGPSV